MKKTILFMFALNCSLLTVSAQQNLLNHVYWQALGNHTDEAFGESGLDTLGQIADTVPHALSIGADGGASYVLNRKLIPFSPDTGRIYKFPGTNVLRGNINGDPYPDFVVLHGSNVTVLFGTAKIDSFDTALVLVEYPGAFEYLEGDIILADCDGDGYDDIILSERNAGQPAGAGIIKFFKGGTKLDSVPTYTLNGASINNFVGGTMCIGNVRNTTQRYLVENRYNNDFSGKYPDTTDIILYPLSSNFHLVPTDTIKCRFDSGGTSTGGFALADVFGHGIDDILIGTSSAVLVYKGGANITPEPNFIFRPLSSLLYFDYGKKIVDVGDVSGRGYRSILVADPDVSNGGLNGGTIYLYNIGKALSDTVKAYAVGGYGEAIGTQVVAPGDLNGDGKADFIVGTYADSIGTGGEIPNLGRVIVFSGDTSYGPVVVREPQNTPQYFTLAQNYPNPVNDATDIVFAVADSRLYGAEVTLDIYDMLGKKMLTAYRGKADNYEYTIRVDASSLAPGAYYYRLACGGEETTRMMTKIQ